MLRGFVIRKDNGSNNSLFLSCQMGLSDCAFFMIKHTLLPNGNHPISSPVCPMGAILGLIYGKVVLLSIRNILEKKILTLIWHKFQYWMDFMIRAPKDSFIIFETLSNFSYLHLHNLYIVHVDTSRTRGPCSRCFQY